MKIVLVFISIIILATSCLYERKVYVKSVKVNSTTRIDWYVLPAFSNVGRSYLQISVAKKKPVNLLESFSLSDIHINKDTLQIQLFQNDIVIDSAMVAKYGFTIAIDTTGGQWNDADTRLDRLANKKVDTYHPHFVDSYCINYGCP